MDFSRPTYSMTNLYVDSEEIHMGSRQAKVFSLLDVDQNGLPGVLRPLSELSVNNITLPVDLMSEIDQIPDFDTVVYNQVIFLPHQRQELARLEKKRNRHASIPNPSNKVVVDDINAVLDYIAKEDKQLVYAHYNLVVSAPAKADMNKITNFLENSFMRHSIKISRRAYNQLELFVASFPATATVSAPTMTASSPSPSPPFALCTRSASRRVTDRRREVLLHRPSGSSPRR